MRLSRQTFAVLPFVAWLAAAATFPSPTGYVSDFAKVLDASAKARLEARLQAYQRDTTNEIAIAIFPSLQGRTIEDLAARLLEQWGVGKRGTNNGILIVVAIQEHRLRIEVGYGLEGKVPDAQTGRIIRDLIAPRFQQGDYAGGLEAAIDELTRLISGTAPGSPPNPPPTALPRREPSLRVVPWNVLVTLVILAVVWRGYVAASPRCPRCHSLLRRDTVKRASLTGPQRLTVSYTCPNCGYREVRIERAASGWAWGIPWWSGVGGGWSSGGFGGGGGGFGGFGGGGSGGGGASGSW